MAGDTAAVQANPFSPQAQASEATKRFSSEHARAAVAEPMRQLERDGYVILRDRLNFEKLRAIRAEFDRLYQTAASGDTEFGGFETQRLYNLVARTRVLDELFLFPELLAIIEAYLSDQIQLSIASSVKLLPGETAQPFHRDDAYYPMARPHMPLSLNAVWAIDDFTVGNGATLLMPGSHTNDDAEPSPAADVVQAEMPAGSVVMWDGSLFHAGGPNRSDSPRLGVTVIYCRAWLRQQENQFLAVPPDVAKTLSRPLQKLIGYWVANNLLGYVNDASPRQFLL